jgi:hypothetical protein
MTMHGFALMVLLVATMASAKAADVTYRTDIRPLWQARCAGCHGAESPYLGDFDADKAKYMGMSKGPRMDSYADLLFFVAWPDTGALMRRLDDGKGAQDGKAGNMYLYLGANEAERQKNLTVFKSWVGDDAWSLKRRDAITKDELSKIKAKY